MERYKNAMHFMSSNCHRQGKGTWPDRDSNQGSLAYRASTELPSHMVSTLQFPPELDSPRICSEPCRKPMRQFLCSSQPDHGHIQPPNVTGTKYPDLDSNQGYLTFRASTLTTEL